MRLILILLLIFTFSAKAQSSLFEQVYNIMQSNCATSGCHDGNSYAPINMNVPMEELFNTFMEHESIASTQPFIKAGYPDQSFLMAKCNNGLYPNSQLADNEGAPMPLYNPPLSNRDIEVLRTWILMGADMIDEPIDDNLIESYYTDGGLPRIEAPELPQADEGFQIYFGIQFLAPQAEFEIKKKELVNNTNETLEINRIEMFTNDFSHHFAVYKINEGAESDIEEGATIVSSLLNVIDFYLNANFMVNTQFPYYDLDLPENTAFTWEPGAQLILNYHIKNYSTTQILPVEFYVNIYTQPVGTAEFEMKAETINYGGDNPFALEIEAGAEDKLFTHEHFIPDGPTRSYWIIQGHTHELGNDFDIWLRNADGTKGEQIYEGFYNTDHTENQGFFDYAHPPVLRDDNMLTVNMADGFIMEATYTNPTENDIGFGLTTEDEMFAGYLLYVDGEYGDPTSTQNQKPNADVQIFPNPSLGFINFDFGYDGIAHLELHNIYGQLVVNKNIQKGEGLDLNHLPNGIYTYAIQMKNEIAQGKINLVKP